MFHFTLEGVLRVRESLEEAELQRLQAIAALIARGRIEIQYVENELSRARSAALERVSAAGMTGAELYFEQVREARLNALLSELRNKLLALEKRRTEQQTRYFEARKQREILTSLYKRQFAEYELEQSRRAQRALDDLFILRRLHNLSAQDPPSRKH